MVVLDGQGREQHRHLTFEWRVPLFIVVDASFGQVASKRPISVLISESSEDGVADGEAELDSDDDYGAGDIVRVHHSSVATPHAATVDGDHAAAEDLGNDFGVGPHNIAALIANTARDSQLRLSPIGDPDLALSIDGSLSLSEELKLRTPAVQKPLPSQALRKILDNGFANSQWISRRKDKKPSKVSMILSPIQFVLWWWIQRRLCY